MKSLIKKDKNVKSAQVVILGFTFKENCPDTRNTKVIDIVNELREYGIIPKIVDPQADADEAQKLYGIQFQDIATIQNMDAVILAVAHKEFEALTVDKINSFYKDDVKIILDIKGLLERKEYEKAGYTYWRL